MDVSEAEEVKPLRAENARLKKLVADLSLDKDMLQSVIRKLPLYVPTGINNMGRSRAILRCFVLSALAVQACPLTARLPAQKLKPTQNVTEISRSFVTPPDDSRITTRWWWFGSSVTKPELEREILSMKAGGFGGFEIQPVYPLALDDPRTGFRNLAYLSPDFLNMVKFAAEVGRKNHLRVDLTLSSGWPYGGPTTPITEAASCLRMVTADVPAAAASVAIPTLGNGESILAVFLGTGTEKRQDLGSLKLLAASAIAGRVSLPTSSSPRFVMFFIATRTGQHGQTGGSRR